MHVIATAGHVDHGKSSLVKELTGQDPDRLAEEHRRGLSIELGYCWTSLDHVGDVAFVDVPGHERFIATMLSGVGPVPAVLFVVAADDPWMPQAAEHLAALDALGVARGVVAVSRSDLADPAAARERAITAISGTTLHEAQVVCVSARTGQGLSELREALVDLIQSMPAPERTADVRLWVDRRFTLKGVGTVVTGTLPAGRIHVGDSLHVGTETVRVRQLHALGRPVESVESVARVALNVTGDGAMSLSRGGVLTTPGAWLFSDHVDVRLRPPSPQPLGALARDRDLTSPRAPTPPAESMLHIGSAAVATWCRPLGGDIFRLRLARTLPLRIGDRALLRDPGSRVVWGLTVLDPAPPPLTRRGAAVRRAADLQSAYGVSDLEAEIERRGLVHVSTLRRIGVRVDAPANVAVRSDGAKGAPAASVPNPSAGAPGAQTDGWLIGSRRAAEARLDITRLVDEHDSASPLDPGLALSVLAERLRLPSAKLVLALVPAGLTVTGGRVTRLTSSALPPAVARAVQSVHRDLIDEPFAAPTADRLRDLGLDAKAIAAAAKVGALLKIADGIVLPPGADLLATRRLNEIKQPFTSSEARVHLHTTRRVVLPLLEHLDRRGLTERLPDDRRRLR